MPKSSNFLNGMTVFINAKFLYQSRQPSVLVSVQNNAIAEKKYSV